MLPTPVFCSTWRCGLPRRRRSSDSGISSPKAVHANEGALVLARGSAREVLAVADLLDLGDPLKQDIRRIAARHPAFGDVQHQGVCRAVAGPSDAPNRSVSVLVSFVGLGVGVELGPERLGPRRLSLSSPELLICAYSALDKTCDAVKAHRYGFRAATNRPGLRLGVSHSAWAGGASTSRQLRGESAEHRADALEFVDQRGLGAPVAPPTLGDVQHPAVRGACRLVFEVG